VSAQNPQTVARSRAYRLLAAYLGQDREASDVLGYELGQDREAWERLTLELVAFLWAEVLQRFGVDLHDRDADWPVEAVTLLERDLAVEADEHRKLGLSLTLASVEAENHPALEVLLAEVEDYRPVVVALADLVVAQRTRQAQAELLGEVLGGLDVLLDPRVSQ